MEFHAKMTVFRDSTKKKVLQIPTLLVMYIVTYSHKKFIIYTSKTNLLIYMHRRIVQFINYVRFLRSLGMAGDRIMETLLPHHKTKKMDVMNHFFDFF